MFSSFLIYIYISINMHDSFTFCRKCSDSNPTAGDKDRVDQLCTRSRRCMDAILRLVDPDTLQVPEEERAVEDRNREVPLPGETEHIWAIEDPATSSRQRLPKWMAGPIEKAVLLWGEQKRAWEKDLFMCGGKLAKAKQQQFDEWKGEGQKIKLLFNKRKQTLVHKVRANVSMKLVTQGFLSVEISMDADPDQLTIKSGSNAPWRLLLLESEPFEGSEEVDCPPVLDGGVDASLLEALKAENLKGADDDDLPDEHQAQLDEQEALLEADMEAQDDVKDCLEVLVMSDDETWSSDILGAAKKVKSFHHRLAYTQLEEEGLVMLPYHCPGMFLSHHSTSNTWQGFFPNCHSGLSFTYGNTTGSALAYI